MTAVVIVGAGMAGLACARRLREAGLNPIILDKGRGVGGRVGTRRVDGYQFDHGAQDIALDGAGIDDLRDALKAAGHLALWVDGAGKTRLVGTPSMSAIPKALAIGLDIRQNVQVTQLRREGAGWLVEAQEGHFTADCVVVTVPPAQAAALLGPDHPLAPALRQVVMEPCLTLMAAIAAPPSFVSPSAPEEPLAWISQESSKPGRPAGAATAWVAQASVDFSMQHLETPLEAVAELMAPMLCARLGVGTETVVHMQAHRWRYARVAHPFGEPYLRAADGTLHCGGDWCLGQRIEHAWASGTAMAEDVIARL